MILAEYNVNTNFMCMFNSSFTTCLFAFFGYSWKSDSINHKKLKWILQETLTEWKIIYWGVMIFSVFTCSCASLPILDMFVHFCAYYQRLLSNLSVFCEPLKMLIFDYCSELIVIACNWIIDQVLLGSMGALSLMTVLSVVIGRIFHSVPAQFQTSKFHHWCGIFSLLFSKEILKKNLV